MSETLVQDQAERIARGRAIAETYDWERVVARILEVYQRVSERSGQSAGWRSQAAA